MTAYATAVDIRQVLKAGAKAFVVKGALPEQIRETVRSVARGESFLPQEIAFKLLNRCPILNLPLASLRF